MQDVRVTIHTKEGSILYLSANDLLNIDMEKVTIHNEHGPAIYYNTGYKVYYKNGKKHNADGPAVIYKNNYQEYWLDGREYNKKEYDLRIYELKRKGEL